MKAIVQSGYGAPDEVLALRDVEQPPVGHNQVLVRVAASAVAGDDWHLMRGWPWVARLATGLRRPRHPVPGREVAGQVEAVGAGVTGLRPGDQVFGWAAGALAQYAAADENALAPLPVGLTPEEAAVTPISALTALQALRDVGRTRPGDRVLVIGASGGVGSFAVQIAVALGARVTGVASAGNHDLVRSLGAERAIDYTGDDPAGHGPYEVIVDLVGVQPLRRLARALAPDGTLVMVAGSGGRVLKGTQRFLAGLVMSPFIRGRMRPLIHQDRREDLDAVISMIAAGSVRPVLSATYPLEGVVEAIRHFAAGHARGKVAITI
ncbi:MAG: NAD(P)-dependent alcohol dehydrogenase [Miltoncostaeaceae bacterium]